MKNAIKGRIVKYVAIAMDVGAPLAMTLSCFPIWVNRSPTATVSGLSLILIFFSSLPFLKQIKEYFKSPSVVTLWLIAFAGFLLLYNIIEEILVITFVGTISNILGAWIYRVGKLIEEKTDASKAENSKEDSEK